MYESKTQPPISNKGFAKRIAAHIGIAATLLIASIGLGMAGYNYYEDLGWRDAFLNTAILLGGMGPVNAPTTDGGKLFAGLYALYAGLVFLIAVGIVFTPILHRVMHKFHWDEK